LVLYVPFLILVLFERPMSVLRLTFLVWLFFAANVVFAQDTVYVNTRNLILRDRPETRYNVFAVLQAGCPLQVEPYDDGYISNKSVKSRFYRVLITYANDAGGYSRIFGWIEKRFVVPTLVKVTVPGADKSGTKPLTELMQPVHPLNGENKFNASQFPPPVYKGAEYQPGVAKRVYHNGPRGGCYYLTSNGRKVYVDKKFCTGR
jgi:hypothetical protein